jgi:Zn-dependent M16 (insulinase) family peptidase
MVEFQTKKPKNDFAVNLINQSSSFITHSNDPFVMLRINEFSEKLKKEMKSNKNKTHVINKYNDITNSKSNSAFKTKIFSELIDNYLLNNLHRLKLILRPKKDLFSQLNLEELDFLQKKEKNLKPEEINKIKEDTQKLLEHQNKLQDYNCLPSISIDDIPRFSEKIISHKEKLLFGKKI